jgi:uncharacterized protein (TIGR02466 family)
MLALCLAVLDAKPVKNELSLQRADALWVTPLFTFYVHEMDEDNALLAAAAIEAHSKIAKLPRAVKPESQPVSMFDGANHALFSEQQRRYNEGLPPFLMSPDTAAAFDRLRSQIVASAVRVLQTYQMSPAPEDLDGSQSVFIWATVHTQGSAHRTHFHENSGLSGVYYVQVPCGSGGIAFYDPRGGRPPFTSTHKHDPKEGELLVFPSWLQHSVTASSFSAECEAAEEWGSTESHGTDRSGALSWSPSEQHRVSFSFNFGRKWEDTNNLRHKLTT